MSSRLFQRIREGKPAFGAFHLTGGTELVEIMGRAGLDFVCTDLMLAGFSWEHVANVAVACRACGMTPMIRLESNPWSGNRNFTLAAQVEHAYALGFQSIQVSCDSLEDIKLLVEATKERHHFMVWDRRFTPPIGKAEAALDTELKLAQEETLVFPFIESLGAWDKLDEIFSIKGLQAIMIGVGDLRACLSARDGRRKTDEEMRTVIADAVARGKKKGVMVFANMYTSRPETPEHFVKDKARWSWDIGMPLIWLDWPASVCMLFYENMISLLRKEFGEGKAQ